MIITDGFNREISVSDDITRDHLRQLLMQDVKPVQAEEPPAEDTPEVVLLREMLDALKALEGQKLDEEIEGLGDLIEKAAAFTKQREVRNPPTMKGQRPTGTILTGSPLVEAGKDLLPKIPEMPLIPTPVVESVPFQGALVKALESLQDKVTALVQGLQGISAGQGDAVTKGEVATKMAATTPPAMADLNPPTFQDIPPLNLTLQPEFEAVAREAAEIGVLDVQFGRANFTPEGERAWQEALRLDEATARISSLTALAESARLSPGLDNLLRTQSTLGVGLDYEISPPPPLDVVVQKVMLEALPYNEPQLPDLVQTVTYEREPLAVPKTAEMERQLVAARPPPLTDITDLDREVRYAGSVLNEPGDLERALRYDAVVTNEPGDLERALRYEPVADLAEIDDLSRSLTYEIQTVGTLPTDLTRTVVYKSLPADKPHLIANVEYVTEGAVPEDLDRKVRYTPVGPDTSAITDLTRRVEYESISPPQNEDLIRRVEYQAVPPDTSAIIDQTREVRYLAVSPPAPEEAARQVFYQPTGPDVSGITDLERNVFYKAQTYGPIPQDVNLVANYVAKVDLSAVNDVARKVTYVAEVVTPPVTDLHGQLYYDVNLGDMPEDVVKSLTYHVSVSGEMPGDIARKVYYKPVILTTPEPQDLYGLITYTPRWLEAPAEDVVRTATYVAHVEGLPEDLHRSVWYTAVGPDVSDVTNLEREVRYNKAAAPVATDGVSQVLAQASAAIINLERHALQAGSIYTHDVGTHKYLEQAIPLLSEGTVETVTPALPPARHLEEVLRPQAAGPVPLELSGAFVSPKDLTSAANRAIDETTIGTLRPKHIGPVHFIPHSGTVAAETLTKLMNRAVAEAELPDPHPKHTPPVHFVPREGTVAANTLTRLMFRAVGEAEITAAPEKQLGSVNFSFGSAGITGTPLADLLAGVVNEAELPETVLASDGLRFTFTSALLDERNIAGVLDAALEAVTVSPSASVSVSPLSTSIKGVNLDDTHIRSLVTSAVAELTPLVVPSLQMGTIPAVASSVAVSAETVDLDSLRTQVETEVGRLSGEVAIKSIRITPVVDMDSLNVSALRQFVDAERSLHIGVEPLREFDATALANRIADFEAEHQVTVRVSPIDLSGFTLEPLAALVSAAGPFQVTVDATLALPDLAAARDEVAAFAELLSEQAVFSVTCRLEPMAQTQLVRQVAEATQSLNVGQVTVDIGRIDLADETRRAMAAAFADWRADFVAVSAPSGSVFVQDLTVEAANQIAQAAKDVRDLVGPASGGATATGPVVVTAASPIPVQPVAPVIVAPSPMPVSLATPITGFTPPPTTTGPVMVTAASPLPIHAASPVTVTSPSPLPVSLSVPRPVPMTGIPPPVSVSFTTPPPPPPVATGGGGRGRRPPGPPLVAPGSPCLPVCDERTHELLSQLLRISGTFFKWAKKNLLPTSVMRGARRAGRGLPDLDLDIDDTATGMSWLGKRRRPHSKKEQLLGNYDRADLVFDADRMIRSAGRNVTEAANAISGFDAVSNTFKGIIKDTSQYRRGLLETLYITEGLTVQNKDLQSLWQDTSNLVESVRVAGFDATTVQKTRLGFLRQGVRDEKTTLTLTRQSLNLARMIGANAEDVTAMFAGWHNQLRLGNAQMAQMGRGIQEVARSTGLTGENLLRAVKSSEMFLKGLRDAGNLSAETAKNFIKIKALSQKLGIEEGVDALLKGLQSGPDFLKNMEDGMRNFVVVAGSLGGGDGLVSKLIYGQAGDKKSLKQLAGGFETLVKGLAFDLGFRIENLDELKTLPNEIKFMIDAVLNEMSGGKVRIGNIGLFVESLREAGKTFTDTVVEIDSKLENATKLGLSSAQMALLEQQRQQAVLNENLAIQTKFTEIATQLRRANKDVSFENIFADFGTQLRKSYPDLTSFAKDMDVLGLDQTDNMALVQQSFETTFDRLSEALTAAGKRDVLTADRGDIGRAIRDKNLQAIVEFQEQINKASQALEVSNLAATNPMSKLEQSVNELNATIRQFTTPVLSGFVDAIGEVGLALMSLAGVITTAALGILSWQLIGSRFFNALYGAGAAPPAPPPGAAPAGKFSLTKVAATPFVLLGKNILNIGQRLKTVGGATVTALGTAGKAIVRTVDDVVIPVAAGYGRAFDYLAKGAVTNIGPVWASLSKTLTQGGNLFVGRLVAVGREVAKGLASVGNLAANYIGKAGSVIANKIYLAGNLLLKSATSVAGLLLKFGTLLGRRLDAIGVKLLGVGNAIGAKMVQLGRDLGARLTQIGKMLFTVAGRAGQRLADIANVVGRSLLQTGQLVQRNLSAVGTFVASGISKAGRLLSSALVSGGTALKAILIRSGIFVGNLLSTYGTSLANWLLDSGLAAGRSIAKYGVMAAEGLATAGSKVATAGVAVAGKFLAAGQALAGMLGPVLGPIFEGFRIAGSNIIKWPVWGMIGNRLLRALEPVGRLATAVLSPIKGLFAVGDDVAAAGSMFTRALAPATTGLKFLAKVLGPVGAILGGVMGGMEGVQEGRGVLESVAMGVFTGGVKTGSMFSGALGIDKTTPGGKRADEALGIAGAAAQGALVGTMLMPILGPLGPVIGALASVLLELYKIVTDTTSALGAPIRAAWESIKVGWENLVGGVMRGVDAVLAPLSKAWNELMVMFTGGEQTFGDLLSSIPWDAIIENAGKFVKVLLEVAGFITWLVGEGLGAALSTGWALIKPIVHGVMEFFGGIYDVIKGVMEGDWDMVWGGLKRSLLGALEAIAVGLVNYVAGIPALVLGGVGTIFNKLGELVGDNDFGRWLQAIGSALQGFSQVVRGVVEVLSGIFTLDWEKIKSGLGNVGEGLLKVLSGAFDFLWLALKNAVYYGAMGLVGLITKVPGMLIEGLGSALSALGDYLGDTGIGRLVQSLGEAFSGLGNIFSGLWGVLSGLLSGDWSKVWEGLSGIGEGLGKIFTGLVGVITSAVTALPETVAGLLSKAFTSIGDWLGEGFFGDAFRNLGEAFAGLVKVFKGVWGVVTGLGKVLLGVFTLDWAKIKQGLGNIGQGLLDIFTGAITYLWNGLKAVFGGIVSGVINFFTELPGKILGILISFGTSVAEFFQGLWDGALNILNSMLEFFTSLPGQVMEKLAEVTKAVVATVKGLWDDLWSGEMFTKIKDGFMNALQGVWDWIKSWVKGDKNAEEAAARRAKEGDSFFAGTKNYFGGLKDVVTGGEEGRMAGLRRAGEGVREVGSSVLAKINPMNWFEEGTNRVVTTGLGVLHEGEAVVPAKEVERIKATGAGDFSRQEFFGAAQLPQISPDYQPVSQKDLAYVVELQTNAMMYTKTLGDTTAAGFRELFAMFGSMANAGLMKGSPQPAPIVVSPTQETPADVSKLVMDLNGIVTVGFRELFAMFGSMANNATVFQTARQQGVPMGAAPEGVSATLERVTREAAPPSPAPLPQNIGESIARPSEQLVQVVSSGFEGVSPEKTGNLQYAGNYMRVLTDTASKSLVVLNKTREEEAKRFESLQQTRYFQSTFELLKKLTETAINTLNLHIKVWGEEAKRPGTGQYPSSAAGNEEARKLAATQQTANQGQVASDYFRILTDVMNQSLNFHMKAYSASTSISRQDRTQQSKELLSITKAVHELSQKLEVEQGQVSAQLVLLQPDPLMVQPELVLLQPGPLTVQADLAAVQPDPLAVQPELVLLRPGPLSIPTDPTVVQPDPLTLRPELALLQPDPLMVQPELVLLPPDPLTVQVDLAATQQGPLAMRPELVLLRPDSLSLESQGLVEVRREVFNTIAEVTRAFGVEQTSLLEGFSHLISTQRTLTDTQQGLSKVDRTSTQTFNKQQVMTLLQDLEQAVVVTTSPLRGYAERAPATGGIGGVDTLSKLLAVSERTETALLTPTRTVGELVLAPTAEKKPEQPRTQLPVVANDPEVAINLQKIAQESSSRKDQHSNEDVVEAIREMTEWMKKTHQEMRSLKEAITARNTARLAGRQGGPNSRNRGNFSEPYFDETIDPVYPSGQWDQNPLNQILTDSEV